MPREGEYDLSYPNKLIQIGLELNETFKGSKEYHSIKCLECNDIFVATPISKLQNFKKHQLTGCPICTNKKKYVDIRKQNLQKLLDKGLQIDSVWDGTTGIGIDSNVIDVTVTNTICGHQFVSTSKNLLTRGVTCPICAQQLKITNLNKSSKERSEEWRKTATPWRAYKAKVSNITKISYRQNKHIINPNNLKFGRAGEEGAYHLDHIVPVRYCFEHNIPEELCGHPDNLQILEWRDNISCRDNLKDQIPTILKEYC